MYIIYTCDAYLHRCDLYILGTRIRLHIYGVRRWRVGGLFIYFPLICYQVNCITLHGRVVCVFRLYPVLGLVDTSLYLSQFYMILYTTYFFLPMRLQQNEWVVVYGCVYNFGCALDIWGGGEGRNSLVKRIVE